MNGSALSCIGACGLIVADFAVRHNAIPWAAAFAVAAFAAFLLGRGVSKMMKGRANGR